jgi:hypothetical protein
MNQVANSRFGRLLNLLIGQLAKFDFFNDITFIMTAYYCEMDVVAYLALIVSAANVAY